MFQNFASVALFLAAIAVVRAEEPKRQDASFTHTLAAETAYYTTSPQQGRPPDGKFNAGQKVTLLRAAGSYSQVRTESGVVAFVAANALKAIQPAAALTPDVKSLAESNNRFATDLFGRLSSKEPGNLFFSPYSISTALAMTYAGAEGQTEKQMAEVLHFGLPEDRLLAAFASLREISQPSDSKAGFQLRVANRLWGQQGYHVLPQFQQAVRNGFGADLAPVDFARQTEAARRTINAWVEKETEQKIQNLIAPGVLDPSTRLVLTNAICFKGAWTDEFKKAATQDAPFKTANQQVMVPMMHQTDDFKYAAVDDLQILELPYGKERELSMVVLLPAKADGLAQVEKKLTDENLQAWLTGLRSKQVSVSLPRFKMTSQFQLKEVLESMGMTLAFSPGQADFSGISTQEEMFISAVIHKAFVDVNEEGTEAAAATGVVIGVTSAPVREEPVVFRADHPFVFLIRDTRTGSILFLGRLMNPKA